MGADEASVRDGIRAINRKYRRRRNLLRLRTWAIIIGIVMLMAVVSAKAGGS